MSGWPRAGAFDVDGEAADRLSYLLELEECRVQEACRRLQLTTSACALACLYAQEQDLPLAGWLAVLTSEHRRRLGGRAEKESVMWQPAEWDHWDILDPVGNLDVGDRPELIAADLIAAGCEDPEGAFLMELAHRLCRRDWADVMPVTEDFACFVVAQDLDWQNLEMFRATVPPGVAASWERDGWLSAKTASGLEGALRALGVSPEHAREMTAALLETYDFDEANSWLDEPGIEGWLEDDEWEALARPKDWTPREAIRRGHIELARRAAREEGGL